MKPSTIRRLRAVLAALAVAVVVWVAFSFKKPAPAAEARPAEPRTTKPRMTEYIGRRNAKDGREFVLRAAESEGSEQEEMRLKQPDLSFTYFVKGKLEKGSVVADECIYTPTLGKAVFQGHVKINGADGLMMETDSLAYDERMEVARTESPVTFRRKDVSGSGRGLVYDANAGTVQIDADARLKIADEKGDTEIRSTRALVNRADDTIRFVGDVVLTKVRDELRAGELIVNFNEAGDAVQRAEAIDKVYLRTGAAEALGAIDDNVGGMRELRGHRVDMWFRPDKALERMEAGPEGELTIHPGPKDEPEVKRLAARMLTFLFNEAGQLVEVQGHKESRFVSERKVKGAPKRTMACQNFFAQFDPLSGQMEVGEFSKDVTFTWPGAQGSAQKARFERQRAPGGLLMFKDEPELREAQHGSRLTALAIDVEPETGNVRARHQVRHVIPPRRSGVRGLVGTEAETVITCRFFGYDARRATGTYRDEALFRSGKDELRADEIVAEEGGRKVTATGQVISILAPKTGEPAATAVEARSKSMVYDERIGRIHYEGEVTMRHGEVTTRSPRAVVVLTPDGKAFEQLEASSRVVIEQGKKQATGDTGVYRPADKTVVLNGNVGLKDDQGQRLRGRRLQFRIDEEAVQVDGREEARTETVLQKGPTQ